MDHDDPGDLNHIKQNNLDDIIKTDGANTLFRLCDNHYQNKQIEYEFAELLLNYGVDARAKDDCGKTALHKLCEHYMHRQADSRKELIELLIKSGADVNASDDYKAQPLHNAAKCDHVGECISCLLDLGADTNARNQAGQTPLDIATQSENEVAIKLLS